LQLEDSSTSCNKETRIYLQETLSEIETILIF
jgi:hypothetical protein